MASWSAFNEFDGICYQYLPSRGEGDTMASQIVTAICKLVYKWFNDGDVYEIVKNTRDFSHGMN